MWDSFLPNAQWALDPYWAWGLVAGMKLLLALAGLLAFLVLLQPSEVAALGNSPERSEQVVGWRGGVGVGSESLGSLSSL